METKKNAKVETAEKKKVKVKKYRFLDSKYKKRIMIFLKSILKF
ncbi:Uncharacterised protein [Fusobacterium varium]|nr:hypothetical protein [Fusobacterium varium]VEH38014.1 Uncharacterised protein [Fusobacterium varium]